MNTQELESKKVLVPVTATLAEIEKVVILEALKHNEYNRTRTAKVLGIGIRTLQRKLKQYKAS
jgi:DNA-binding NtrC family response regulator